MADAIDHCDGAGARSTASSDERRNLDPINALGPESAPQGEGNRPRKSSSDQKYTCNRRMTLEWWRYPGKRLVQTS